MKIGVGLSCEQIGDDPDVYRAYARRAEELGLEQVARDLDSLLSGR